MAGRTAGVILAAGAGSRFGQQSKLLAELDGRALLQHVVDALGAVDELDPLLVVLGAHAAELLTGIQFGRARTVTCPNWAAGLSESLRCGVGALEHPERVLVTLGDSPGVNSSVVRRLLEAGGGVRACYGGVPGHPVLLGPAQLSRLGELRGDTGARELLQGAPMIECGDLGFATDVDTPADLARLRRPG